MNNFWIPLVLVGAALTANNSPAATFSSTTPPRTTLHENSLRLTLRRVDYSGDSQVGTNNFTFPYNAGSDAVSLTVDTTANTASFADIDLKPVTTSGSTQTRSNQLNFMTPAVPPDFPNPVPLKQVSGLYSGRLTITSLMQAAPSFVSAPTGAIQWNVDSQLYSHSADAVLTLPNITLTGTFAASGPTMTVTQPLNVLLTPVQINPATALIPGSSSFGNGFTFSPRLFVRYQTASPILVDQIVEDVRFVLELQNGLFLDYFVSSAIPEPSAMSLALIGLVAAGLRRRR